MSYRQLIKKIQHDTGFSDSESQDALEYMIESIAERLQEDERSKFASQLPLRLKIIALNTETSDREDRQRSIIEEFMEKEDIPYDRAKKQVLSAWSALKSFISEGQIAHLKSQMPTNVVQALY